MFDKKQLDILNQELDISRIKTREKGNISLSYIEGHDVIETANRVFGFGNWSYSISKLEQVSQEQNQNQNHVICYKAKRCGNGWEAGLNRPMPRFCWSGTRPGW